MVGKGLAPFPIGPRQKLDTKTLTKFNHVDHGQCRGMLIDYMYNECMTLIWYDLFF